MNYKRGNYNEIELSSLNARTRKQVNNLFNEANKSEKIDGHGNWEFGMEYDRRTGETHSVNWDLFAIGKDYFSKRLLIIIQIREFYRRKKNYHPTVKKSYFLIGRNEDNTAFAHPVLSRTITNAISKGKDPIRAVQKWIFKADYTKILRQGDIALIPLKSSAVIANEIVVSDELMIEGSHYLRGQIYATDNNIYVKNPTLNHLPKTHPDFVDLKGVYKVISGSRASFYDFAPPTVD